MEILPPSQQHLWQKLQPTYRLGYVLYGGTAIALRLGHRTSVDFDFFSEQPLNRDRLYRSLPFLENAIVLQDEQNCLTCLVSINENSVSVPPQHVKISFFAGLDFGRVDTPDFTADRVIQVASLNDLLATKLKVILQRAEAKDYCDIAALINAGLDLSKGLAASRALYGKTFQPSESLKAMTYFNDGDLHTLTVEEKNTLIVAVGAVRELPELTRVSTQLTM